MERIPVCMLPQLAQPASDLENERVDRHSEQVRSVHREWSEKIRTCDQRGFVLFKTSSLHGDSYGKEIAYMSPDLENTMYLRFWGVTANDIGVLDDQLARYNDESTYLALFTEWHVDTNRSHVTLFAINHLTGDQAVIFHRSDCVKNYETLAPNRSDKRLSRAPR